MTFFIMQSGPEIDLNEVRTRRFSMTPKRLSAFEIIAFKPSKDNIFTHPNEESEFQIYGVKHVHSNDNS